MLSVFDRGILLPTAGLIAACAVWGVTFVTTKDALADVSTLQFLFMRFTLAAVALALIRARALRDLRAVPRRPLLALGGALAAGYIFQTFGLEYTRATNAGFITGLVVVFTPLLVAAIDRVLPKPSVAAGAVLATAGLGLLSLQFEGGPRFASGDVLVLFCAVAFAFQLLLLGHLAPRYDAFALNLGMVAVSAAVFAATAPLGGWRSPFTPAVAVGLASTVLGSTVFGFTVHIWAQSRLSPSRTAVILTMEPVFAGISGFLWAGDRLSARNWLGAGLIVVAILVAELGPEGRRPATENPSDTDQPTWRPT